MDKNEIIQWLREEDEAKLETLWQQADAIRKENVGDAVHLRGLIEISNRCVRRCAYCGLNATNADIQRYRMKREEIIACAHEAVSFGYGTVVMQAGEDYGIETEWLADIIREIKRDTKLAVTLSLGERPESDLVCWREAGADRYLLRFETTDMELYQRIHPKLKETEEDRFAILDKLRKLGYEVGSGIMIGIPGQTYETVANDILMFQKYDMDMIGVGPYIMHPDTPLADAEQFPMAADGEQVPNAELMVYKVLALTRIACPQANLPSTTALATINTETGRELGLSRGANVVMPNLTPIDYRNMYEIYPGKACINETAGQCQLCLQGRIASIGRFVGKGRGDRGGQIED